MIEYRASRTEKGGEAKLLVKGSGGEVTAETLALINAIYKEYMHEDPVFAFAFRDIIIEKINDPTSPVWNDGTEVKERVNVPSGMVGTLGELLNKLGKDGSNNE